ncbi:MAG: hypothetical protein FD174_3475 [Geobacteraceae bacterium]|nr:MAG: hypothetical protein FD174_3475 [Geobacteraceae bacterium]
MNLTFKAKLMVNAGISAIALFMLIGISYFGMRHLAQLQDRGHDLSEQSRATEEAAQMGVSLYGVIADAVINRDLEQSGKYWAETKQRNLERLEKVMKIAETPQKKEWAENTKRAVDRVIGLYENKLLSLLRTTPGITEEIRAIDGEIDREVRTIQTEMLKFTESVAEEAQQGDKDFDSTMSATIAKGLVLGLIGILVIGAMSAWIMRSLLKSLNGLLIMLKDIAEGEGDLTKRLDDSRKDELGEISHWFNIFINKLQGIISEVAQATAQVASAANQLLSTSEQMATGAEEVAAQAGTVAAAGEEMAATSAEIAQNCGLAAEGAKLANDSAVTGASVVQESVSVMNRIAERVKESACTVENLGERSDQIGAIIGTIEDIADQTNLLALNAAIEAARAGEQGRGFAVVADEVRALAERTSKATREIGEMIKTIQQETKGAVVAMEDGVKEVEKGTVEAAKSGRALQDILDQINDVTMQINQVATAAEEQTATTNEISNSMQQITEVVQETSSGAHQSADAASRMTSLAGELQRLVGQFKLAA